MVWSRSTIHLLRKLSGLPPGRRAILFQTSTLLVLIHIGLRVLPFNSVRRLLLRFSRPKREGVSLDEGYLIQVAWAVEKAGDQLLGDKACLTKALAGHFLLSRYGYWVNLKIGALKEDKDIIHAHAWLELGDKVIIGGTEQDLQKFVVLPDIDGVIG